MNDSIGYASYQQQYNASSSSPYTFKTSDTVSIVLFFSIIVLLLLSFVVYFWYTEIHKVPMNERGQQVVGQQQEIYLLVDNVATQVKTTFKIPIITLIIVLWKKSTGKFPPSNNSTTPTTTTAANNIATNSTPNPIPNTVTNPIQPLISNEHQRVFKLRLHHLFSIFFIVSFIISLAILIGAVNNNNSSTVLQAALFVFVLSINLYLITRQRCYYMERRKLFGNDDAHMNAIYETRFSDWDRSMLSNWVQLAILIIEFFQYMTFPLRDLITITSFSSSSNQVGTSQLVSFILNAGGLMPDMRTPTWYTYSLWTSFATILCSLILGIVIHAINWKYPYKISTRWVRWCIPVATLLYIPILTAFVSSAACQSLNTSTNDYYSTLRCHSDNIPRQLYLWLSLFGYFVSYFLMTIFLTSYERVPTKNEIAYKSISVAFIKNMGLLLALVFLLVESTTNVNRMRAILSITIILTMICYNIKTRPCYVDKINFFRTGSFTCILWTSALVAILSDTNAAQSLGPFAVIYIIIGGWVFIIACFTIIYFIYYIQPPDHRIVEFSLNSTSEDLNEHVKYADHIEQQPVYDKDVNVSQATAATRWYSDISKWFIWSSSGGGGSNSSNAGKETHY